MKSKVRFAAVVVCTCTALSAAVCAAAPAPPSSESLDRQLLEGLDEQLLENLNIPGRSQGNDADAGQQDDSLQVPQHLDGPLFRKWSDQAGEDLGQPGNSPLVEIEAAMRAAQELIAQRESVQQGVGVQEQVVADLDKLIQELEKQCAACQQQNSSQQQKPGSRRSQTAGAAANRPASRAGVTAAEDSTTRLEQGSAAEVNMGQMQELLKDLWGHLPQRVREQLLQAPTDEFLPKYQLEIEKYFRRLAEEGRQDEPRP